MKTQEKSPLELMAARRIVSDLPSTVDIDVSAWYGEGVSLTLRRLTFADKWTAAGVRADAIKKKKPLWPDELCTVVATLGTAHVAPESGGPGPIQFYISVAEDTDEALLDHIQSKYREFVEAGRAKRSEADTGAEAEAEAYHG